MMTYAQAKEMAAQFDLIGGFTSVEVEHFGFLAAMTPEAEAAENWQVNLWSVNTQRGNRNLKTVWDYSADQKVIKIIAKMAKGKATARDMDSLKRAIAINADAV